MGEEPKIIMLNGGTDVRVALVAGADAFLVQLLGEARSKTGTATLRVAKNASGVPFVAVFVAGKHAGFLSHTDAQGLVPILGALEQQGKVAGAKATVAASQEGAPIMRLSLAAPDRLVDAPQIDDVVSVVQASQVQPIPVTQQVQAAQPPQVQQATPLVAAGAPNRDSDQSGRDSANPSHAVVYCPSCGSKNGSSARFCSVCGLSLEALASIVSQPSETASISRPRDSGENADPESRFHSEVHRVTPHLQTVASAQKLVIYAVLLGIIAEGAVIVLRTTSGAFTGAGTTANGLVSVLSLAALVVMLIGVRRLAAALGDSMGRGIVYLLLMFVPLINLITLLWLNSRATSLLRAAGLKVGLLGARG